ncbi:hypothetical protein [Paenibacillus turpanensis]|uniref:hypothetical protein n=1 Tax=Paenibacillus turpanensis TaxID=2689078 RepID=UPI0014099E88|nr:hypothetical protein [Paenibacillus turpanensis]
MLTFLLVLVFAVIFFGAIGSYGIMRRQQHHELDKDSNNMVAKHPARANPIVYAYIAVPIIIALITIVWLLNNR